MLTFRGLAVAIATAVVLTLGFTVTHAQSHLPSPCAALDNPPPAWFHCPTPYVELVRTDKYDGLYARGWHCRETGHSLGTFSDHEGCGGGRHMLLGWELPAEPIIVAQATETSADFHAEIVEWVVQPCMEVAAALDLPTLNKNDLDIGIRRTDIAQIMTASRDAVTRDLAGKMKASATWEERSAAYPMMLEICLAGIQRDAQ